MKYLKLKSLLKNEGDEITVQVVGKKDPVKKEFKGVTKTLVPLEVIVNGESYEWQTSDDQRRKIKENGCGATFVIRAYKSNSGYVGFNYVPQGDVSLNYGERKQVDPKKEQDDFQDKVSRGAAWNNAFMYVSAYMQGDSQSANVARFCKEVMKVATKIAPYQKTFVKNEPIVEKEDKTSVIEDMDASASVPNEYDDEMPF